MAAISQATLTTTLQNHKGTSLNNRAVFNVTDFSGLDFSNLQVTGAKFPLNSNFTNCKFKNSQMRGTFFAGANINTAYCNFSGTNWENINCFTSENIKIPQVFENCAFINATFLNCNMSNSIFINCLFNNLTVRICDFSNSLFYDCQFDNIVNSPYQDPQLYLSNFKNCLFESTNTFVVGGSSFIPNAIFNYCNFENASFIDLVTSGNGTTDIGLQFYNCNLLKSVFKFRNQAPLPTPQKIDKYYFASCTVGNSVVPYANPPSTTHVNVVATVGNDLQNAVTFDRNVFP
jgi:uncharacterized protein YjbI with pentapeptide repeats